jgi:hypothetical protein
MVHSDRVNQLDDDDFFTDRDNYFFRNASTQNQHVKSFGVKNTL